STITRSEARILPLLIQVGVTNKRLSSRRTDKFPSVAATKPFSCSIWPNCTISRRCWRSLTIEDHGKPRKPCASWYRTSRNPYNHKLVKICKRKATDSARARSCLEPSLKLYNLLDARLGLPL